jgi:phosphoserine phosphatase
MIRPIANLLKIPQYRIYANNILFDEAGNYSGFDDKELTCRDGGKASVIDRLMALHDYTNVVMIGDGATDMQARPPASAFIGFMVP